MNAFRKCGRQMNTSSEDMLDWMPVQLTEEEALELLAEEDMNGKLV